MYSREFAPGDTGCCENCSRQACFQPVMEIKGLGVTIMRYVGDAHTSTRMNAQQPSELLPGHIHDTKNNVFIIINRNVKKLSTEDILNKYNINKVPCPRCRYRANKLHKMLQSNVDVAKGDIRGICDHCKDKLTQKTCPICADIVMKFLDTTNAALVKATTCGFKQTAPYVHGPLSTVQKADSEEKHYLGMAKPKFATEHKAIIPPVTELFEPTTIPVKHYPERKPFKDERKETLKICEFPSDESGAITPFVTTFSNVENDVKGSFKYIFPRDTEKEEKITNAALITSSELIVDTLQKFHKQSEELKKQEAQNSKLNLDATHEYDGSDKTSEAKDDNIRKKLRENSSLVSSSYSKETIGITKEKPGGIGIETIDKGNVGLQDKDEIKKEHIRKISKENDLPKDKIKAEIISKENVGLWDKGETKKEHIEKISKEKDIKDIKDKISEGKQGDPDKERVGKLIKGQEQFGQPSINEKNTSNGHEGFQKPQKVVDKTIEYKEDIRNQPHKDVQGEKDQRNIGKPSLQHPSNDIRDKKEPANIGKLQTKDVNVKTDQDNIGEPLKELKTIKDQKEKPPQKSTKDINLKKGTEDSEKEFSTEVKAQKETERIGKPTSKDVKDKQGQEHIGIPPPKDAKTKKDPGDIGEPPPNDLKSKKDQKEKQSPTLLQQPQKDTSLKKSTEYNKDELSKEAKAKKESEHIGKPTSKDIKGKNYQEDIGIPQPKDAKTKKDQGDIGEPPPNDLKSKKDQKEKPSPKPLQQPPKDINLKKDTEYNEKELSKEDKSKKESEHVGKPTSKDVKEKKYQEDVGIPPTKDAKPKKYQGDIGEPPPNDLKSKKDQTEKPSSKLPQQPPHDISLKKGTEYNETEVKSKKESEHIGTPTSKDVKGKKNQEDIGIPPPKDAKTKKDQGYIGELPPKDLTSKKEQKEKPSLKPLQQPPKDISHKKGTENNEKELPKEVKAKNESEQIGKPTSKDVKGKKYQEDIETPPPKDATTKKYQEDIRQPPLKDEKTKKYKEDIGEPPPTDAKTKKYQEDIRKPPLKDEKTKKYKEDIEEPPPTDAKTKKYQEDIRKPPLKDEKTKKYKEDIGETPPTDAKTKKYQEDIRKPPLKDEKTKKYKEDIGEPPPTDANQKKYQEDIGISQPKDAKTKKDHGDIGEPPLNNLKTKKDQKEKPSPKPLQQPPKDVGLKKGIEYNEKEVKSKKESEHIETPTPKDVKGKKYQEDIGILPPKDVKTKKYQGDIVEPPLNDAKTKKYQEDIGKLPPKDEKPKKYKEDIREPPQKDAKTKKYQEDIGIPPLTDAKTKKDQVDIGELLPKDLTSKKDQKEKPSTKPLQQPPKDISLKKGTEFNEKELSKEVKAKKESEQIGKPTSKDVKGKKYQEDIETPPPKDAITKKYQEDIRKPPPKDEKTKKYKEDIGEPPSKDAKTKKYQEDIGIPPPKDAKTKKDQGDIGELPPKELTSKKDQKEKPSPKPLQQPPKDISLKKGTEYNEKELSKEVKAKKESEQIGKPTSKDVKGKKYKEDIEIPPPKDATTKKYQEDIRKPPLKEEKTKKYKEDIGETPPKDAKSKKYQEDIGIPPPKDAKTKKDQGDIGESLSKDLKSKKDQIEKPSPKPLQQPPKDNEKIISKEVKVIKEPERIVGPTSKDVKGKKDLDEIGISPSKDAKTKKDQDDIGVHPSKVAKLPTPPQKISKDVKKGKKPPEHIGILPLTLDDKSKKEPEYGEKLHSKEAKLKKDKEGIEKPSLIDVKSKMDENSIKKLPPPPLGPPKFNEKAKKGTGAEDRRADRKLEKGEDQIGEKGKKDEYKNDEDKVDITKTDTKITGNKDKAKKGVAGKEDARIKKGTADVINERPPSILNMLPRKEIQLVAETFDKKEALAAAHAKMKEMQEQCLNKVRLDATKRFELPTFQSADFNIFKLSVKEPPHVVTPEVEDKHVKKTLNLNKFKIKGPSFDNLLINIIKACKEKKEKVDKQMQKHESKYKIRSVRSAMRDYSLNSFSIDSDLELDLESLTNIKNKGKRNRYKIKNTNIVRDVPEKPTRKLQPDPILYHAEHKDEPLLVYDIEEASETKEGDQPRSCSGVIRYALSNRSYIAKGWTILPTEKIVRQLYLYKVRPANPEFDWFNHNREKGSLQYDTGEKLAKFDEDGRGRLYYRNGKLALDYYDCEEANAQQRFVIYSSGDSNDRCRTFPATVLAMFDYLGSGVVFDHTGKIRLKYNQSEGVVLDRKIGPVAHWKWHTLNDPPVLKQVMMNAMMEDPDVQKLGGDQHKIRDSDQEMLKVELENLAKAKKKKLNQEFQPFQIQMKSLKINDQFSLKILDQAHVYLYFNDGISHIKINLGMILDNKEIIDTETLDYSEVLNSIEKASPKTESLLDLQNNIKQARRCEKMRVAYNERVQRAFPVSSADKLVSAVSKPLRPPVMTTCPASTEQANVQRKPLRCNLYYDTRLI